MRIWRFRLMRYAMAAMQQRIWMRGMASSLVVPMLFYRSVDSPYPFFAVLAG